MNPVGGKGGGQGQKGNGTVKYTIRHGMNKGWRKGRMGREGERCIYFTNGVDGRIVNGNFIRGIAFKENIILVVYG
jgi:hypothetical protein